MCDEREPYVTRRGERGDAQRDASGGVVRVRPASPSLAQFKGVRSGERRGETRRHALLQSSPEVILLALLLDARRLSLREALLVERLRDERGRGSARHGHGSKPIVGRLRDIGSRLLGLALKDRWHSPSRRAQRLLLGPEWFRR